MRFEEAVESFEIQLRANQRSRHTVRSYLRDLGMLRGWLEREGLALAVESITPERLLRFAASPAGQLRPDGRPRRRSTIDKIKMSVRAFFAYLEDAGLIRQSPARLLKYRSSRTMPPEVLSGEEARRLLRSVSTSNSRYAERDEMILEMLLATGLRLDALVGLDVEDVRLAEGRFVVRHMKGGGAVAKQLPEALRRRLAHYLRWRSFREASDPALFLSAWGRRISARQVEAMVAKYARAAGIAKRVTPHVLRHTFATRLYGETKDLLLVQRALDHRFVGTTQRYARAADEAVLTVVASGR